MLIQFNQYFENLAIQHVDISHTSNNAREQGYFHSTMEAILGEMRVGITTPGSNLNTVLYLLLPNWSFDSDDNDVNYDFEMGFMVLSIAPSDEVDQAWHLHMIYTESYWKELCGKVLLMEFHHGPTKGGKAEGEKYWGMYEKTLDLYRNVFGDPPQDIWPSSESRFSNVVFRRVNMHENVVINKKKIKEYVLPYAAGILLGIVASVSIYASGVDTKDLIIFFLSLIVIFFVVRGIWRYLNRNERSSNRYGSGSSSSSSSSSSSGCTILGSFFGCGGGDSGCSSNSGCSSSGCSGCGGGCGGCGS